MNGKVFSYVNLFLLLITVIPIRLISQVPFSIDYAGKTYKVTQIGNQYWLVENLNVGIMIPGTQSPSNDGIIEKYCYGDNEENCEKYGALYQWDEAMQYSDIEGARGICPEGWHIATRADYEQLAQTVLKDGNALKKEDLGRGNGIGTNLYGFSALPAGLLGQYGEFSNLDFTAYFWTSTQKTQNHTMSMYLNFDINYINIEYSRKYFGFCIRCIKDAEP